MTSTHRIEEILRDVAQRRAAGAPVDRKEIEASHAHLMPELGLALDRLDTKTLAPDEMATRAPRVQFSAASSDGPMRSRPGNIWIEIEGYEILGRIGRGGMGEVYKARQFAAAGRFVALKILPQEDHASERLRLRFQREVEIAADLHHPNIAELYDSGLTRGLYYFAMQYIEGLPLDVYCREHGLPLARRLALFQKVCAAVAFAHQRGVIHRDLKPSNILVDATGEPHLLDFGLAKTIGVEASLATLQTEPGQVLGTLAYMSPEQAEGDGTNVDVRSDIYSLGVLGFEMLAGRLPYSVSGRAMHDALRVIREDDPTRLGSADRALRGDLEIIFSKALEKEKDRRYASTTEMAADLARHLAHEPIQARPTAVGYQMLKFARRNRALVTGLIAVMIALILGIIGTTVGLIQARRQAEEANRQRSLAQVSAENEALAAAAARRDAAERRYANYTLNLGLAQSQISAGNIALAEKALVDCPKDLRGWEWGYLSASADQAATVLDLKWPQAAVSWSPDGTKLAAAGQGACAAVYDGQTGAVTARLTGHLSENPIYHIQFTPNGRQLVTAGADATLRRWDAVNGQELNRYPTPRALNTVMALSDDGRRAAYQSSPVDDTTPLTVLDLETGKSSRVAAGPRRVIALAWQPGSERLATIDADGVLALIDLAGDRKLWTEQAGRSRSVSTVLSFDRLGRNLVAQSTGRSLVIRSVNEGGEKIRVQGFNDVMHHAAFNPDGTVIAVAGADRFVYLVRANTGDVLARLRGHQAFIWQLAWSPDGRRLASVSIDGSMRIWRTDSFSSLDVVMETPTEVTSLASSINGSHLLAATRDHGLRLINLKSSAPPVTIPADKPIHQIQLSADGSRAASIVSNGTISIWDLADVPKLRRQITCAATDLSTTSIAIRSCVALSPDGRLVFGGKANQVTAFDATSGSPVRTYPLMEPQEPVWSMTVSSDNQVLAVCQGTRVLLFNVSTGERRWVAAWRHTKPVGAAVPACAFSSDNKTLAVGSRDSSIRLISVATGELTHQFSEVATKGTLEGGAINRIDTLAWNTSGTRIFTSSSDNLIKVWDPAHEQLLLTIPGHTGRIYAMAFSPIDQRLFTGSVDQRLAAWDPSPRSPAIRIATPPPPPPMVEPTSQPRAATSPTSPASAKIDKSGSSP